MRSTLGPDWRWRRKPEPLKRNLALEGGIQSLDVAPLRSIPVIEPITLLHARQQVQLAGAIAETLGGNAELEHQGQRQVRERSALRVP